MAAAAVAQTPPARPAAPRRPAAYPERPPADPVVLDRGKALYGIHCNFCHGSDARGGEGGPNLLRSELVLRDDKGESIGPVVKNGKGEMPALKLNDAQISDVATFIHSFKVGGYDISRMTPPSIVTGDATAGEAYFQKTCTGCHSVTGNLKGIGGRITDAKQLQQHWLMPGSAGRGGFGGGGGPASPALRASPTTVTVTMANGEKSEGRLTRIDDFFVTLTDSEGTQRTFTRDGEKPKVEVNDPVKPHRELLGKYTDKEIHDVTAYLVTVK